MVVNKRFSLGSLVVLMCICLGSQGLMAQEKQVSEEPETKEEKIHKATEKAMEYFRAKEYSFAIDALKEAFGKEKGRKKKAEIAFMLGESYRHVSLYKQAQAQYKRAVKLDYGADAHYWYAEMMASQGEYEDALAEYEELKRSNPGDVRAEWGIQMCRTATDWIENPSRYIVTNRKDLNSRERDMTPIYAERSRSHNQKGLSHSHHDRPQYDGMLYLVSSREGGTGKAEDGWTGQGYMDLWMTKSERKDKKKGRSRRRGKQQKEVEEVNYSTPVPLSEIINSKDHEGTMCFDSRFKDLYFTRCENKRYHTLGCAIYVTRQRGQTWDEPEVVVLSDDSSHSVGHPSLSPDDKILYFAGDIENSVEGSKDLWMTTYDRRKKEWKEPTNLGPLVNTAESELFPFVHDDGYLYFASDGHMGMGGLDIFRVALDENGMPKGEVENMRYPINTPADDFGIVLEPGGAHRGYITSNRPKEGMGSDDIYGIYEVPMLFEITGTVTDTKDGQPIPQVTIRLNGSDGSSIIENSDGFGDFVFSSDNLKENTTYTLSFEKKQYLNAQAAASTVGVPFDSFEFLKEENVFLHRMTLNKGMDHIEVPIVLPNVLFDLAKWDLRPESMVALDTVVAILNDNPNIVIELRSHTDYRDTDEKNRTLSQNRADTCVRYLISKGIASDRLVAVGKGEAEPFTVTDAYRGFGAGTFKAGSVLTERFIKSRSSEEQEIGNQINRRTDFKVLRDDYVPNQPVAEEGGSSAKGGDEAKEEERPLGEFHTVADKRESFGKVAKMYGINVRQLKELNGGLRGVRPFEGLELKITVNGDYDEYDASHYRVQRERSFGEIAKKLGLDKKKLKKMNPDLKDKNLKPGLIIFIK